MASFNKDLQGPSFPGMNFDFPRPDESTSKIIDVLGKAGRDLAVASVGKGLVGEEEELSKEELMNSALNEKELNLRKIKQMREQGLISASGARVMANQAVQSASARLPGRAAEFRKITSAFFGDFGEGQDLLKEGADEKRRGEIEFALRKQAALKGYGYLDPNGQLIQTEDEVNTYFGIIRKSMRNEIEKKELEKQFLDGKASASQAVEYANRHVRTTLLEFMGNLNGKLSRDGVIFNPEEMTAQLATARQTAEAQVDAFLNDPNNKGIVTPQMRTAARAEISNQFETMAQFVNSQGFGKVMKDRRQGVQDLFKIYSYNALPMMAIANEAGGEQGVKFFTEYAPKFSRMNANQREALIKADPTARAAWNTMVAANNINRAYGSMIQGLLPSSGLDRKLVQDAAAWQTSQPVDSSDSQEAKGKAFEILQKSATEGEKEKLAVLTFPETAKNATPEDQERIINFMTGEWAGHRAFTSQLLAPDAEGIKSKHRILYDNAKGEYVLILTPKGAKLSGVGGIRRIVNGEKVTEVTNLTGGAPGDIIKAVNDMNRSLSIMRNFQGTKKFKEKLQGQTIDTFAKAQLEEIDKPRITQERALDAPLSEKEVDDLLIDVRLGGGRESAARRILNSKGIDVDAMLKSNEEIVKEPAATNTAKKLAPGTYEVTTEDGKTEIIEVE